MNNCPNCNHDLVNIVYGLPSEKAIDLARAEGIALGGCLFEPDLPTHYCYGCHEAWPAVEDKGTYDEVPSPLFSE